MSKQILNEEFRRMQKLAGIINENQNKVYGITKNGEPYAFGPYTFQDAEAKAEEYMKKDENQRNVYDVELYNDLLNQLPAIDRMYMPKLDKNGNFMDIGQPFSMGDLADY